MDEALTVVRDVLLFISPGNSSPNPRPHASSAASLCSTHCAASSLSHPNPGVSLKFKCAAATPGSMRSAPRVALQVCHQRHRRAPRQGMGALTGVPSPSTSSSSPPCRSARGWTSVTYVSMY